MVVFPALCMCLVSGEDSSQSKCCSKCFLASRCVFCHFPCCACAVSCIQGSTSVVRSGGIWCCYFIADTEEVLPHKKQTHSCVTPALLQRDLCKVSSKSAFSFNSYCLASNSLSISAPDIVGSIPPRDRGDALCCLRAQFPDRCTRMGS